MSEPISQKPPPDDPDAKLKIYFLPNLLTAGNLFCGFVALTKIVEADPNSLEYFSQIKLALAFILLACIFDLFDGRVARMGGVESPFGREFDSLADLISFGAAPAFLVQRVVLRDAFSDYPQLHQVSWFIASIYLLCGAFRLARFNCLAAMPGGGANKDFHDGRLRVVLEARQRQRLRPPTSWNVEERGIGPPVMSSRRSRPTWSGR